MCSLQLHGVTDFAKGKMAALITVKLCKALAQVEGMIAAGGVVILVATDRGHTVGNTQAVYTWLAVHQRLPVATRAARGCL